jgi:hypothetical protein
MVFVLPAVLDPGSDFPVERKCGPLAQDAFGTMTINTTYDGALHSNLSSSTTKDGALLIRLARLILTAILVDSGDSILKNLTTNQGEGACVLNKTHKSQSMTKTG